MKLRWEHLNYWVIVEQIDIGIIPQVIVKFDPFIRSQLLIRHIPLLKVIGYHFIYNLLGPWLVNWLAQIEPFYDPFLYILFMAWHCFVHRWVLHAKVVSSLAEIGTSIALEGSHEHIRLFKCICLNWNYLLAILYSAFPKIFPYLTLISNLKRRNRSQNLILSHLI